MGVCHIFMKCVLHFFNLLIMLLGLALITVAVLNMVGIVDTTVTEYGLEQISIYIIVAGAITFIISIVGACGVFMENTITLTIYSIFMAMLMAGTLLLTVIIFLTMDNYLHLRRLEVSVIFHRDSGRFSAFEEHYQCCGPLGSTSYQSIGHDLPKTCCAAPPCTFDKISYPGCVEKVTTSVMNIIFIIKYTAVALTAFQLMQVVVSSYFTHSVRNKRQFY